RWRSAPRARAAAAIPAGAGWRVRRRGGWVGLAPGRAWCGLVLPAPRYTLARPPSCRIFRRPGKPAPPPAGVSSIARVTETLGKMPLFRSLDAAAVRRLDQACAWQRARAGQSVLDYQAGGTDLFFVLHGHVRVMVISGPGTVILRDIRDGEFFGELA